MPGDHLVPLLQNRVEAALIHWACQFAGIVVTPLNWRAKADELRAALEDRQTPAEVAEANGVSRSDLVDALVADITVHIEEHVADGDLTQAEADERLADVEANAEAIADGERPEGFGPGGPGRGGPPPAGDEAPADATDTATDA